MTVKKLKAYSGIEEFIQFLKHFVFTVLFLAIKPKTEPLLIVLVTATLAPWPPRCVSQLLVQPVPASIFVTCSYQLIKSLKDNKCSGEIPGAVINYKKLLQLSHETKSYLHFRIFASSIYSVRQDLKSLINPVVVGIDKHPS
jgi:hypothetical protein